MSDLETKLREIIARGLPDGVSFPDALMQEVMDLISEAISDAASAAYYDGCGAGQ